MGIPQGGDIKYSTCYHIPASKLRAACISVCDGQWSRSRDGPILSVSSIMSIIVAFTGCVL